MDETTLTEDDCKEILKKYSPTAEYVSFSVKSLAEKVEGYLSSHFSIKITYKNDQNEEKREDFFMKKTNEDSGFLTEFAKSLEVFKKEIFFYNFTSELEKMKNYNNFAPKSYLCKKDLIVIENMLNTNFYVTEKNVTYTLEEAQMALKTLATFHSSFIAYEEMKSKELNQEYKLNLEYPEEFEDTTTSSDENSPIYKYFRTSIKVIIKLIDALSNCIDKNALKDMITEEYENTNLDYLKKYRQCVLHCDLWTKNIMFKKNNDKIVDCRLVDFQLIKYFLPGYDLSLFFNANCSLKFRQEHQDSLIHYYYKNLEQKLHEFGYNCSEIIPLEDFLDGFILAAPSAKMFAFNDTAVMTLSEKVVQEVMANPENMEFFLIEKRPELILELYEESEDFKNWVNLELEELYQCLLLKKEFVNRFNNNLKKTVL